MSVKSDVRSLRPAVVRSRRHIDWAYVGLWSITGLVAAFLIAPIAIIFLTSFTETKTVEFPPQGFSFVWYERFVDTLKEEPGTRPALARSIWFSTNLGLLVAACSTFGGVLGALALHKFVFRGKEVFQNLFLLPLTFPALIVGVGLLLVFSELRLFDRFTRLMIGHVVFALPYVVICVGASLRVYEEEVEEAARLPGGERDPGLLAHHATSDSARHLRRRGVCVRELVHEFPRLVLFFRSDPPNRFRSGSTSS